jgi:hypothetical protein
MNEHLDHSESDKLKAAFLLRSWKENGQWRFSLENVATRKMQGFESFGELVEALRKVLTAQFPD